MDTQWAVVLMVALALALALLAVRGGFRLAVVGHRASVELARGRQIRRTGTCVRAEVLAIHELGGSEVQVVAEYETPGGRRITTGQMDLAERPALGEAVLVWYLGEGDQTQVEMGRDLELAEFGTEALDTDLVSLAA